MRSNVALRLAARTLSREWRSGELAVLLLALTVAVGALTGVGFLVERVNRAVELQASEVLAADLRLRSTDAISADYEAQARSRDVRTARITSLISVMFKGDASQLANLHFVTAGYPLRGEVKVSDKAFGVPVVAEDIPKAGEIWPDSRAAAALGVNIGDELAVGASTLRVSRILLSRPDQGSGFVDLASAALVNAVDLEGTQLVRPGSRVTYAMLFSGDRDRIAQFSTWLTGHKTEAENLRDVADASPEVGSATMRAGRFLSLASLVSVLLCAVAVAMTARRYVQRHLDTVALLKTLGATANFVLVFTLAQLLAIACVATLLGSSLGFGAQAWLLRALQGLIATDLPDASITPVFVGLATAVLVLIGFALPPLLQLSRVPAIRILRRDIGAPPLALWVAFGPAAAAVGLVIGWVLRDAVLALYFAGGLAAFALVLAGAGLLLVRAATTLRGRVGIAWRYGLANMSRRRAESVLQIMAFGLGLMSLLVLAMLRTDLITSWRKSLPQDAPNFFFVNIPPEDRDAFSTFLTADGGTITRMLPMIRARLTAVNGEGADSPRYKNRRFAGREQNLTWTSELGPDNRIVSGKWFTAEDYGKPLVSVATDFREALELKVGDKLTFDVAGETYEVSIASFRAVKWDSMQPNFFLVFPPGLLDSTAGTYMTSAKFRPSQASTIADLVRRFPSVSVFDMDDLLSQVRSMIDKAVLAVQSVFVFTLLAGITVLLAAVQGSREERRRESAVLRTLGARRGVVLQGVLVEFTTLGLLAGFLAAAGAALAGWLLATRVLEVPYTPNLSLWIAGTLGGALLVGLAGWLATRKALSRSPAVTLRQD